ncbi:MAG TPA: AEC family transporter [Nannocystis sp.]
MPSGDVLPVLLSLFTLVAVGQLLRLLAALPANAPEVLARVIVQVTMPALIVVILADARFEPALLPALVATTSALLVALLLGVLLLRTLGASRPAQGAAGIVASFSNTAFLGIPFITAVLPGSRPAATTAVIIDTVDTTLLLLTLGVAFAGAMARPRPPTSPPLGPRIAVASLRLLRQPMIIAVLVGLVLALTDLDIPRPLAGPLAGVGQATPVLAFLTIGLGLDLGSLRGQTLALAGIAVIKLAVAPVIAALVLLALDVRGEVAQTAVLQAAMPTAMVSVIIAANAGCDARLATAASVVTTVLALATLPLWVMGLQALGL